MTCHLDSDSYDLLTESQCADVTFVASGADSPAPGTCKNNTGVKSEPLATSLNANASNADGSPQNAGSASSSGSATSATSAKATSTSSKGAAMAMATAGWGVLGAAVVGAVAAL